MSNPRKNDNVHRLNGTYRKDRHGDPKQKPKWNESLPQPPACVKGEAKREWQRMLKAVPVGVITISDRAAFTQYCLLWAELVETVNDFPDCRHSQLRLIRQELGFSPMSRGKIGGKPTGEKDSGPQKIPR